MNMQVSKRSNETKLLASLLSPGSCATLACIWEATAPKPGNVYRGADFDDVTYVDFLTSAAVVGPVLDQVGERGVGATVYQAIMATQQAVGTNTNLGMMLLMAPLAAVPSDQGLKEGFQAVLDSLTPEDSELVYTAIREAKPGGLGKVETGDLNADDQPAMLLLEAMQLATNRDLVARQFTNGFREVFLTADYLAAGVQDGWCLSDAIVHAFLRLLAEFPDSLIARKCGQQTADEVSLRAATALSKGVPGEKEYDRAVRELDFWLRADGHRRNPGTSADLVAGGLFVILRDQRLNWPVAFYPS